MQEDDNKDKLKEIIISNFENGKSDNLSLKEVRKKIWNRILNTWSRKTNKKTRERRRQ